MCCSYSHSPQWLASSGGGMGKNSLSLVTISIVNHDKNVAMKQCETLNFEMDDDVDGQEEGWSG